MSEVAEGPAIHVVGRVGFSPSTATASGTVALTSEALSTTTWVSGTREIARLPMSGAPSSMIVPERATATREAVTTASIRSSSALLKGGSST